MNDITEEQYLEARKIVSEYEFQEKEKYLIEKAKPCPCCGNKTDEGDCRKCGVIFFNGVHSIMSCTVYHTHSNGCYVPYNQQKQ